MRKVSQMSSDKECLMKQVILKVNNVQGHQMTA